jgi:hypothetical protein
MSLRHEAVERMSGPPLADVLRHHHTCRRISAGVLEPGAP